MEAETLMGVAELAEVMGLAYETVRWYSTQMPERLPPRVQWSKKPMWSRKVVARWVERRDGSGNDCEVVTPKKTVERAPRKTASNGRPRRATI